MNKQYKINIDKNNMGISLIELIIVITIIAILVGFITPQYIKYLRKSEKATDMQTAARLGDIFSRSLIEFPEAYKAFDEYANVKKKVSATVDGVKEKPYDVYYVMVNEDKFNYWFYGGPSMTCFFWKNDEDIGLYNFVNRELGFEGVVKGSNPRWTMVRENAALIPNYKPVLTSTKNGNKRRIDRWRIVKRADNGAIEIWSAADFNDGDSGGGKACYRVWPNPDDEYTK